MLQIEILSGEVATKSGVSQKNGKPYTIREQVGYVTLPEKRYPVEIKVRVPDDQVSIAPGKYTVHPSSFYPGKFGELMFNLRLMPLVARAAA